MLSFKSNSEAMPRALAYVLFAIVPLLSISVLAQTWESTADRLIQEARKPSSLENNLRYLTDDIGGRVPGTAAMQHAVEWGVEAFNAAGADSVHVEAFTIPQSWQEGDTQMIVTALGDKKGRGQPSAVFQVHAVSIAWAPALAATKRIPIVDVGNGSEGDFQKAGDIAGKIVLVHSAVLKTLDDLIDEYAKALAVVDLAVKGKPKAIAFMATREHGILYRHSNTVAGEIDSLPMVLVAREDGERIGRLLSSKHEVWADLSIPNQVGGPIQSSNVIAEIKGREKPEEFVIVGAHLDSWELGTGALDNGCNAALVVDVLRTIKASGLKPRRSIRFILFSGEEQGMLGSRAYASAHRGELDDAAGVIVYDEGTGKTTGFSVGGRKDVVATAKDLIAPLEQFGVIDLDPSMEPGSDHYDFMLEGVPTFVADQEAANYMENYHATTDTFDKVDLPQLTKHVAETAVLSFGLANLKEKIGPRLTHDQIEQTIEESHSEALFKTLGLWDDWTTGKRGRQK